MAEYIDKEAAINHIRENQCRKCSDIGLCGGCAVLTAIKLFESLPAADVRENVKARWEPFDPGFDGDEVWECSACGEPWYLEAGTPMENNMNFCPNCGAQMGGAE